ncbi:unnamed protein product [Heterobilharzia americana]|nr:unnamed protein product [Heterobilharzia americana]
MFSVALYCILGRDHTSHQEVTKLKPNFILPVRKQLSLIIRFISSTLEYLEFLFMPNSSGESPIYGEALHTQLISLTDRKFQDSSTFSKDRLYTHLPNDVLSFKLKMCKFSSNLSHSIQEEGHSILVDLLHKSWKTWRNDAIEACQGVLSESLSHVSCFETLVDLRTVTLALVQRLQTPSSLVTKTTDYFTATPDFRQFTFDIWAELLSDLFLQRLKVLFTETLEDSFNDWITQFDELLTLNSRLTVQNEDLVPKTQLINRSSLKNPVEEGQIDWADFVWSDGMRDINVNSSSIMKDSVLCEASSVQSNNVGLAVFCCLAYTPIPNSFSLMASEKEQDLTSSSQLLVFLQRLVSENISSASNCTHISSFGNTDLEKKLHILLPDLQSLCEKLNMDISNRIIKLTSNVGRDSFDIWSLVLSALEKSLKRLANWITNKAYGKEIINNGDCPDVSLLLKVNPCCGLLLSRAWYALVDCCPSIIAASIAAIGQIESGRTMNAGLGNSTNSTKSTENISTIEGLVWTNISLLRRGWESLSQPLFELVNRITLDSLLNATVKNSVFEEFSDNLRLMTSIRFKKTDNEFTNCTKPNLSFNEDTVEGLLLKYTTVDVMLRGIVPFEEVQLELDSSQATEDMDTSLAAVIHVPSQLSLPMHQMLLNIVYVMEKLLVHRPLQPPYNHIFLSKVCTCFLDVYSTVVDELFSQRDISDQHSDDSSLWLSDSLQKLIQTRALQIIFDLKFLQRLLVSSVFVSEANLFQKSQTDASSKNVQTSVQGLISRLETLVDPFDWNVCASRLSRNVTNAITSTYHLYAPIIGSSSFSQIETLRGVKSSSKEEDWKHLFETNLVTYA